MYKIVPWKSRRRIRVRLLALVEKIAKAQNFQEIVTLQTHFAQEQMQAYATEMQELQGLIGETVQKLQRG